MIKFEIICIILFFCFLFFFFFNIFLIYVLSVSILFISLFLIFQVLIFIFFWKFLLKDYSFEIKIVLHFLNIIQTWRFLLYNHSEFCFKFCQKAENQNKKLIILMFLVFIMILEKNCSGKKGNQIEKFGTRKKQLKSFKRSNELFPMFFFFCFIFGLFFNFSMKFPTEETLCSKVKIHIRLG